MMKDPLSVDRLIKGTALINHFKNVSLTEERLILNLNKASVSVVHPDPDPAGSEIICKLGSGSVINTGSNSGSGSKLSSASN